MADPRLDNHFSDAKKQIVDAITIAAKMTDVRTSPTSISNVRLVGRVCPFSLSVRIVVMAGFPAC